MRGLPTLLLLPLFGTSLLLLAAMAAPGGASAHGRLPEIGRIAFHPTDENQIVLRATFGLLISSDAGSNWEWVCADATGMSLVEDPNVLLAGDGAIIAPLFSGLRRGTESGCRWDSPFEPLTSRIVIDAVRHPDNTAEVWVVTSDGNRTNGVYRSEDNGIDWSAVNAEVDPLLFETINLAPSDPSVVYLAGSYPPTPDEPRRAVIFRSADAGENYLPMPFSDFREGDRNIFVRGVDPTNPERILVHVLSDLDDRLMESTNGGESFREVLVRPDINAFAWSSDGTTVVVGSRFTGGLARSVDRGASFIEDGDGRSIGCLEYSPSGELWACANGVADGFDLGRSTDDGRTFVPVLQFADIDGIIDCPDDALDEVCRAAYRDLIRDLLLPVDAGVSLDAGVRDAGQDGAPGVDSSSAADAGGDTSGGGCGCSALTRDEAPAFSVFFLLMTALFCRRSPS